MNTISYYDRSKLPWDNNEILEVKREYEEDLLNIIEIGNNHKRTPGCIAYKLKNIGLITHNSLAKGYTEYKTSELYKEICGECKKKDLERAEKKKEKIKKKNELLLDKKLKPNTDISLEIKLLKEEIIEMKKDMKQMLTYMNLLYEFETDS